MLTNTNTLRVISISSKWRCTGRANHLGTTLVAFVLLFQTLLQRFHELFPAAKRLNFFHLFFGKVLFCHLSKPFFGKVHCSIPSVPPTRSTPLKLSENTTSNRSRLRSFYQRCPGKIIKTLCHRIQDFFPWLQSRSKLPQCDRNFGFFEFEKKWNEHALYLTQDII
ncbi:hypothetical protein GQR58_028549 [Nymphon striatum]|nr:hypothetical protein GQR58_028549 [Nymphon striatum]